MSRVSRARRGPRCAARPGGGESSGNWQVGLERAGRQHGPLASAAQLDKFLYYVQTGVAEGATLRCGGT